MRLWQTTEAALGVDDLRDVAAALTNLTERQIDPQQAVHAIGSGTLLCRVEDGRFTFVHQSVAEWLVARHAAEQLKTSQTTHLQTGDAGQLHASDAAQSKASPVDPTPTRTTS